MSGNAALVATLTFLLLFVWDLSRRVEQARRARKDLRHAASTVKVAWRILRSAVKQLVRAALVPVVIVALIWLAYIVGRSS